MNQELGQKANIVITSTVCVEQKSGLPVKLGRQEGNLQPWTFLARHN